MSSGNAREVELSHGRTRYVEAGAGPPVVLLHGVGFTSGDDSWWPIVGPLSTRLRVLAPDFMGWGLSDRFDREYSFAYLVDFVREFQDALGLSRTHIVGHSMGGWIATLLAYESPQRVDKLALVAAGGVATRTLASMTAFTPPSREQIETQLRATVKVPEADFAALTKRAVQKTQVPGAVEAYQKILNHMNDPEHRRRYNTLRRLPHITAPTLIVWGREDKVNALELGEQLHAGIKDSRLAVVEECGHFVPTEKPDELSRLLLDFLTA
jgi:pimeloyl-ACP methyl ester carboxylesterase